MSLSLLALAVGAAGACGSAQLKDEDAGEKGTQPATSVSRGVPAGDAQLAKIPEIAEKAVGSVVNISSTRMVRTPQSPHGSPFFSDPFFRRFFGPRGRGRQSPEQKQRSLGSGVVVSKDGVILTNNHVVEDAEDIQVTFTDERELEAELVGTDPQSDLAVIELKDPPDDLEPMTFGDSDRLRLGEVVLAVGNPFGVGQTVTMGIVSAKGRANVGIVDYEDFIQTDAAINPGNSGGALVNLNGELVGINTAILSRTGGYQGIGFAIPSKMAQSIMTMLREDGEVERGFLGVMIQDLSGDLADALGVDEDTRGVLVSDVFEDSPAAKAGLEPQDIIVEVEGEETTSTGQLRNIIAGFRAGQEVEIVVLRDGERETFDVTLTEREADEKLAQGPGGEPEALENLQVQDLTDALREKLDIPPQVRAGAVITGVRPGSGPARAGLRPGDVVLQVNKERVKSAADFQRLYGRAEDKALLRVHRGGMALFVVVEKKD